MFRLNKKYNFKIKYNSKNCASKTLDDVKCNNFTIRNMPHPLSLPLIGTKLNFIVSSSGLRLHEYIDKRHKQLGPIFYESIGGGAELVFTSDPHHMKSLFLNLEGKYPTHILPDPWILYEKLYGSKRGLFFMNGEEWLINRRVMNKNVLREESETWLESLITPAITRFIQKWKDNNEQRSFKPNLEEDLYRLSIEVIIQILTGNDSLAVQHKHYDELLELFSISVKRIFQTTNKLYSSPVRLCEKFNLKVWREFKESVDSSIFLAQKIVSEILSLKGNTGLVKKLQEENLNQNTITRIVADFVIAAGDTTAYTTLWILYLISTNGSICKELRKNAGDALAKNVVKEAMRMYPVAPFLTRILPHDSTLGSYSLKSGTPIIASIYTSGRDEKYFTKADEFLPYRWDRNDSRRQRLENHVPSATLPFALGARSCIGRRIALIQLTEVVKQITDNFNLKCTNKGEVKPVTSQVLVPNQNIEIEFSLRTV